MDEADLRQLLDRVSRGDLDPDRAVEALRHLPYADLGFARVDHHRQVRQGMAEAVYGPGKQPDQTARIVGELLARSGGAPVVLTRASADQISAVTSAHPGASVTGSTVVWRPAPLRDERIVVVTAGTADLPVADECVATLAALGFDPRRITDVGVAGVHRILNEVEHLVAADAVIVIAGMEGALASVVGGLTGAPVVAVPTGVGYGAAFEGVTALLGMLASCAAGVAVVGIDNGYGAACSVARMFLSPSARRRSRDDVDSSRATDAGAAR